MRKKRTPWNWQRTCELKVQTAGDTGITPLEIRLRWSSSKRRNQLLFRTPKTTITIHRRWLKPWSRIRSSRFSQLTKRKASGRVRGQVTFRKEKVWTLLDESTSLPKKWIKRKSSWERTTLQMYRWTTNQIILQTSWAACLRWLLSLIRWMKSKNNKNPCITSPRTSCKTHTSRSLK